jgi:hypothetical protein
VTVVATDVGGIAVGQSGELMTFTSVNVNVPDEKVQKFGTGPVL